ncbi:hypothetical protein FIBSPDRAFT_936916 [Athelia psychrophila]|uniref:Uncharacterized protein n=1 Tax=Athelia psychrophila TaxID=1759441 RepID=A0A166BAD7_9AGAM|nr:hypothetical protein FIBSPDRAFT_936916 [Fibularhizoctonia sp. CBS 109695]
MHINHPPLILQALLSLFLPRPGLLPLSTTRPFQAAAATTESHTTKKTVGWVHALLKEHDAQEHRDLRQDPASEKSLEDPFTVLHVLLALNLWVNFTIAVQTTQIPALPVTICLGPVEQSGAVPAKISFNAISKSVSSFANSGPHPGPIIYVGDSRSPLLCLELCLPAQCSVRRYLVLIASSKATSAERGNEEPYPNPIIYVGSVGDSWSPLLYLEFCLPAQCSDISGIGVRVTFYAQSILIVLAAALPNTLRSDVTASFWALALTTFSLLISALIEAATNNLSLYNAILVSYLCTLHVMASDALLAMIHVVRAPNTAKKSDLEEIRPALEETRPAPEKPAPASGKKTTTEEKTPTEKVATTGMRTAMALQSIGSAAFGCYIWQRAETFGSQPECNADTKLIFFGKSESATLIGHKLGVGWLVFILVISLPYDKLPTGRLPWEEARGKIKGALESKEDHKARAGFVGGFFVLVVWLYIVVTMEVTIQRNPVIHGPTEFGFGQVLSPTSSHTYTYIHAFTKLAGFVATERRLAAYVPSPLGHLSNFAISAELICMTRRSRHNELFLGGIYKSFYLRNEGEAASKVSADGQSALPAVYSRIWYTSDSLADN